MPDCVNLTESDVNELVKELPPAHPDEDNMAFRVPWELRTLAVGVAAHVEGSYPWPEFQHELSSKIAEWERDAGDGSDWQYYEHWVNALEIVLEHRGVISAGELDARTAEVLATPRDLNHQHAHAEPVAVSRSEDRH